MYKAAAQDWERNIVRAYIRTTQRMNSLHQGEQGHDASKYAWCIFCHQCIWPREVDSKLYGDSYA